MTDSVIPIIAVLGSLACVVAVYLDGKASADSPAQSSAADRFERLRWAVELASSNDPQRAELGISTLSQLAESAVTDEELDQIDSALSAVLDRPSKDLDDIDLPEEDYPNVTFVTTWGRSGMQPPSDHDDGFDLPSTPATTS
jgi:hypothetical protein